jgi:hypothetical protein
MQRPVRFEHHRYVGDKRKQVVYDLDEWDDPAVIDELLQAETFICFGPDTLAEARNRGYRLARPGRHHLARSPR